ncbi:hypothetical protein [Pseudonocardia lacus]|uniref:hypothetical protein n=1 Tax=Pseudonocardia lacus TaxID=2835865 RepID=UPI001BDD3661|nr:hypothetical protein [Pseudonocardia lacus]
MSTRRTPGSLPGFGPEPLPAAARRAVLTDLRHGLDHGRVRSIGYPGATDIDFAELAPLHRRLVNNVGDPESPGRWLGHTKNIEHEVVEAFATLFGGGPAAACPSTAGFRRRRPRRRARSCRARA